MLRRCCSDATATVPAPNPLAQRSSAFLQNASVQSPFGLGGSVGGGGAWCSAVARSRAHAAASTATESSIACALIQSAQKTLVSMGMLLMLKFLALVPVVSAVLSVAEQQRQRHCRAKFH